jgi:fructose-1,6-bisphosphatase/inositol monophosphatase family enzyme
VVSQIFTGLMNNVSSERIASLLSNAEEAVLAAGLHILALRKGSSSFASRRKEDGSLVMKLDQECEDIAFPILSQKAPVVAEETVSTHQYLGDHPVYYVLDPIDGTSACNRFFHEERGQIGFGPLVGLVIQQRLTAATFFHLPSKTLFSARVGSGVRAISVHDQRSVEDMPHFSQRMALHVPESPKKLQEAVLLFHIGSRGEGAFLDSLRTQRTCLNYYRFGGFANDCIRLAQGKEDLLLQLSIKPWDLAAALFPLEIGYGVTLWTHLKGFVSLLDWDVQMENPLFIAPPHLKEEFGQLLLPFLQRGS